MASRHYRETPEQIAVVTWLSWHKDIVFCHVPNGGSRTPTTARLLQRLGTKAGVPDLLIFTPPPASDHVGMAIEMKAPGKQGRASSSQQQWLWQLHQLNWLTMVCYGARHAIQELEIAGYGGGTPAFQLPSLKARL